jgi:hypothetical protein
VSSVLFGGVLLLSLPQIHHSFDEYIPGGMAEWMNNELLHYSSVPRSLGSGRADIYEARGGRNLRPLT